MTPCMTIHKIDFDKMENEINGFLQLLLTTKGSNDLVKTHEHHITESFQNNCHRIRRCCVVEVIAKKKYIFQHIS
jgi:hypothetical protein